MHTLTDGRMIFMPHEIDAFSRVIGALETQVENLAGVVDKLGDQVQSARDATMVRRGVALILSAIAGAGGAKILAALGLLRP